MIKEKRANDKKMGVMYRPYSFLLLIYAGSTPTILFLLFKISGLGSVS